MPGIYQYDLEIKSNVEKLLKDMKQVQDRLDTVEGREYTIKFNIDEKKLSNVISNLEKMLDSLGKGTGDFKQFENLSKELSSIVSEVQSLSKAFGKVDDSGAKTLLSSIQNIDKSLSELSQNILNVNKNMSNMGGNTSGTVKQVENITNESKKAAEALEDVAKAQGKVNGQKTNISSGMKDTFPKTSENLEQVAQSEQKIQQEARAIQSKWEQAEKAIQNYMNAVTKLNNLKASDKSTGKKSYEIAGQIEEIEKLKKEAYDARQVLSSMINPQTVDTDTWKRYVDVIKQLDQASNGSAESVNRLKDSLKNTLNSELNSLQNSIDKYQNIITQAKTYPSDFKPSTEYNTKLAKLESANEVLKNYKASLQGVTELTKEQQNQINRLTQNCEKATTEFKNLSAAEKGTIKVGVEKAIQRINKDLAENTKYSAKAKSGLNALLKQLESGNPSINLRKITEEIIKIENAEIAAGRAGKSLWDIFKTKSTYGFIGQMQSYLSMYIGFYGVMNKIKSTISTVKELDTALVDLKKTTTMNTTQLNEFYYSANDVARQMGVTTEEIINQASAWSRLGYSSNESATEMAKLSSQFASISPGMDIDTATDGLVSTMKAFDVSVDEVQRNIMDNINKIGNTAATSNSEIVDMLTRSSAAMAAANNTLEETIALETAAVEITRSSESTGTAFKTLSMRLRGYDEETESYTGDVEELSGAIADLTKTASTPGGISLFTDDTKQTYKSTYQLLKEISEIWDQLSDKDQAQLLEKLAGKRGGQVVAGLLSNFSAAEKAMKDMGEAAGSSDAEMGIIEQSIEYKLNNLKEIWVGTAQSIANRDSLGGAIDVLSKLSEGISFVIKNFGLLKTTAIGLTGYLSFKNVGGSKMYDLILF